MTEPKDADEKKKPGPDPEMLKIEGFTMEEVAKKMLATSTEGDWEESLAKMKAEEKLSDGEKKESEE